MTSVCPRVAGSISRKASECSSSYNRYAGESSATIEQNTQSVIIGRVTPPPIVPPTVDTTHFLRTAYNPSIEQSRSWKAPREQPTPSATARGLVVTGRSKGPPKTSQNRRFCVARESPIRSPPKDASRLSEVCETLRVSRPRESKALSYGLDKGDEARVLCPRRGGLASRISVPFVRPAPERSPRCQSRRRGRRRRGPRTCPQSSRASD